MPATGSATLFGLLPEPMRTLLDTRGLRPLAALAGVLALALLAGCGGGGGADSSTDPQQLLDETFNGQRSVDSGVLDISLDASASGSQGGSLSGSVKGPFQSQGADKLPELDVSAQLKLDSGGKSQSIDGALTLTGDGAYVTTGGKAYAVDDATFQSLQQAYAQSAQAQSSSQDQARRSSTSSASTPSSWLTDVTNEGTEEVGGTETVHVSGTPDVAQILADAQRLDPTGQTGSLPSTRQLANSVKSAQIDVYTGADDKILRKLDVSLSLQDPSVRADRGLQALARDLRREPGPADRGARQSEAAQRPDSRRPRCARCARRLVLRPGRARWRGVRLVGVVGVGVDRRVGPGGWPDRQAGPVPAAGGHAGGCRQVPQAIGPAGAAARERSNGTPDLNLAFFRSPDGLPYVLVPLIPVAIALDLATPRRG